MTNVKTLQESPGSPAKKVISNCREEAFIKSEVQSPYEASLALVTCFKIEELIFFGKILEVI